MSAFNQAIFFNPVFPVAHLNRAIVHYGLGNEKKAIEDLNTAIEMGKNTSNIYFFRGVLRKESGDYEGALIDYDRAIDLDSSYTNAIFNRSVTLKMMGDYSEAMVGAEALLELAPETAAHWNLKGNIQMLFGDYFDAINSYDEAIREDADYAEAYFNRGLAYTLIYAIDRACSDFEDAKRLGYDEAIDIQGQFCGQ